VVHGAGIPTNSHFVVRYPSCQRHLAAEFDFGDTVFQTVGTSIMDARQRPKPIISAHPFVKNDCVAESPSLSQNYVEFSNATWRKAGLPEATEILIQLLYAL